MKIVDGYPTILLKKLQGNSIGIAQYNESIFKMSIPQHTFIQVTVTLWPSRIIQKEDNRIFQAVRFGEMNLLRYVPLKDLFDVNYYTTL